MTFACGSARRKVHGTQAASAVSRSIQCELLCAFMPGLLSVVIHEGLISRMCGLVSPCVVAHAEQGRAAA